MEGSIFGNMSQKQRTIREVMDLRSVIEPPISERAAVRHLARELDVLDQPLLASEQELLKSVPSPSALQQFDVEFHSAIARVTHNPLLIRLVDDTHEWMAPTRADHVSDDPEDEAVCDSSQDDLRRDPGKKSRGCPQRHAGTSPGSSGSN